MFFITTCVSDVMIGRSELRRRLGNTGISVRNTATRRCWNIYWSQKGFGAFNITWVWRSTKTYVCVLRTPYLGIANTIGSWGSIGPRIQSYTAYSYALGNEAHQLATELYPVTCQPPAAFHSTWSYNHAVLEQHSINDRLVSSACANDIGYNHRAAAWNSP